MLRKLATYLCIIAVSAQLSYAMPTGPLSVRQDEKKTDNDNVVIPEGTILQLSLRDPVSSKLSEPGDEVIAILKQDLYVDGVKILNRYTEFVGRVTLAQPAKRPLKSGRLHLTFDKIRLEGGEQKLVALIKSASNFDIDEKVQGDSEGTLKGGKSGGKVVDNVLRGASVGGIGATIVILSRGGGGLAPYAGMVGAGAVAGILLTKGNEVRLAPDSVIRLKLEKSLSIE